jgi:HK97 family phage portal protein
MKFLGLEISFGKKKDLSQIYGRYGSGGGGWYPIIEEPFTGAWQRNMSVRADSVTAYHAVFACITLIASDIKKLRIKTIKSAGDNVWLEINSSPKTAVLSSPNQYQNSKQFMESWILSKLLKGNTYILKSRDARGVVNRLWVLDPCRVKPLVSDSGEIFYELQDDNLSGRVRTVTVPASDVIHDRMNCFYHPLCGISPLYAAWLAATQGLSIQQESVRFFDNKAVPGGILSAPSRISEETVKLLKDQWQENYGGANRGKIAVLGDGLKFEAMAVTARETQMLEQANATGRWVCEAFHVPPWKIGLEPMPSPSNPQAANVEYYSSCLQSYIEDAEECLDKGLELTATIGVEFDTEGLLRMDTLTQISALEKAQQAGLISPNEGRAKLGYGPAKGGDSPMVQQQYFSLEALAERDAAKPFAKPAAPAPAAPAATAEDNGNAKDFGTRLTKQILRRADRLDRPAA